MKSLGKVSRSNYITIATSCFCGMFCLAIVKAMLPMASASVDAQKQSDPRRDRFTRAQKFREPEKPLIKPPKLIRSDLSKERVIDFSDNGAYLVLTSDQNDTSRTYEIVKDNRRTPLKGLDPEAPVALSPEGRAYQRPNALPTQVPGVTSRSGAPGPGSWSPATAGPQYVRRFYEDGSYLVARAFLEKNRPVFTVGRVKDNKFAEVFYKTPDLQTILDRTSDNAIWMLIGNPERPGAPNQRLLRHQKGKSKYYPILNNRTQVSRLSEGAGVIAASMLTLRRNAIEQIYIYNGSSWDSLPRPKDTESCRLIKVMDNGWILGAADDPEHGQTLTILWKDKVPVVLNDLPGWPKNGAYTEVVGSARNGDLYVKNATGNTYGSEEFYLIHLSE